MFQEDDKSSPAADSKHEGLSQAQLIVQAVTKAQEYAQRQAIEAIREQSKADMKALMAEVARTALAESNATMAAKIDKLANVTSALSTVPWKDPAKEAVGRQMSAIRIAST